MKRLLLIAAGAAALSSTAALADDHHDHGDDNRGGHFQRMDHHGRWNRGERLPDQFHRSDYVVNDYGRYGWERPPEGYAYYRTDTGDYVLAAVATGLIASVIANSR